MEEQYYRQPEIRKYKMTWLSKESYSALRKQKVAQKKSMMRILDNLIKEKYGEIKEGA